MTISDQPGWLGAAWRELGQREIAGAAGNGRIAGYFRDAGHGQIKDDETAWCAAFVGAVLERSGVRATRSLRARSYLQWGTPIAEERTGAIAVLSRGGDPALGHVGFLIGATDDRIILLGGNQSDAVTVTAFERTRLLSLRWPCDAVGTPEPSGGATDEGFEAALAHVLEMEGGYSDDPYDPGGPTNFGITLRVYADFLGRTLDASSREALKGALKDIPAETVREIYRRRYWVPAECPSLTDGLGLFHFDAAVNHGVGTAIRSLQEAVGVEVDGEIGDQTRAALAADEPAAIIARYAAIRERRYRALPHFWRFGRGWLSRVAATRTAALARIRHETNSQQHANGGTSMTTSTQIPGPAKWWGHSLTVWGAIVTALAAILPAMGPLVGVDIPSETVRQLGSEIGSIVQALAGVAGTLMTLFGRARATAPLMRRGMNVRL